MTDQITRWSGFGLQTRSFLAFFSSLSSSSRLQVRNEIFLMPWYSLCFNRCGFVRFAPLNAVSFRVNEKKTNRWKYAIRLATRLRWLASTCVDFGRSQIWTQVDASRRKSLLPFGLPAQVDTSWSLVICCHKNGFLRLASRLANPFGHSSQVRISNLRCLASTCESVWPEFSYMPTLDNRSFKGIFLRFVTICCSWSTMCLLIVF